MKDIQKLLSKIFTSKLFALLLLIGAVVVTIYVYQNPVTDITKLLNSNYFVGLITAGAGAIAFLLYFKQKADNKKDAAKTIYAELVYAEKVIQDLKRTVKDNDKQRQDQKLFGLDANKFRLGESSWNKLKYFFINDFDANEWEKLNTFFNQREAFEQAIIDISNLFPKNIEYRTKSIQEELAKLAVEHAQKLEELRIEKSEVVKKKGEDTHEEESDEAMKIIQKYNGIANRFKGLYINIQTPFQYQYNPVGTYIFLEKDLDNIDLNISISSIGQKLKEMSN